MELDLHGFSLNAAIREIYYALDECKLNNIDLLIVIHGYQQGQVIKNHIRSTQFTNMLKRQGYNVKLLNSKDLGKTSFQLF